MKTEQMRDILARCAHQPDACWIWTHAVNRKGYGIVAGPNSYLAHRLAYEAHHGKQVPDGLQLDHTCEQPSCINPQHMQLVNGAENMRRREDRSVPEDFSPTWSKHTCKRGHPLIGEGANVYVFVDAKGLTHRACRPCVRMHGRKHDREKRPARSRKA